MCVWSCNLSILACMHIALFQKGQIFDNRAVFCCANDLRFLEVKRKKERKKEERKKERKKRTK